MRVFTLGNGFVADHLPYQKISERVSLDWKHIDALLSTYRPDVLINCIGKTGRPNVDWCENNKEATATANTALPIMLAEACTKYNTHLIHIGSGCIFFGESPNFHHVQGDGSPMPELYDTITTWCITMPCRKIDDGWKETDFANPQSFYSKSKYACDLMLGSMPHVSTLRIRMPISEQNNQRNLINKLRGYKQVIEIPNSITFMSDLVRCIDWMSHERLGGIFHVVNPQPLTAGAIMREFQKRVDANHKFEFMSEEQLNRATSAKRSNCILSTQKLQAAGFTMSPTQEALEKCMIKYGHNLNLHYEE